MSFCIQLACAGRAVRVEGKSYLGESTVVPEVALVREAVPHEAELALLDVLLDWVEGFLFANLCGSKQCLAKDRFCSCETGGGLRVRINFFRLGQTHLHLSIGPSRNLDNHVEDGALLVGIERDVMERAQRLSILFNEDAMLQCIGSTNLANAVLGAHLCS
jgi:hypothetical protein